MNLSPLKNFTRYLLLLPYYVINTVGNIYGGFLSLIKPNLLLSIFDKQLQLINSSSRTIQHLSPTGVIRLSIWTPNSLCGYRVDTFSSKEPETLEWIDEFGGEGTLFDIGANIGLYSLYYATTKAGNVYSFEPSVLNLNLLAKNIHVNRLDEKIFIIPNPLTSKNGFAKFSLSSAEEGGALSSFGVNYGHNGDELETVFSYKTFGLSLDYMINAKLIEDFPALIKIDVDGIEHLILAGAANVLKDLRLKSLLIEVNDDFQVQAMNVERILKSSGFYLREKRHSEMIAAGNFSSTYNQIWCRTK